LIRIFVSLALAILSATAALADIRADVRDLFAADLETLDFARVKIEVDRMIDPSIDVEAQLAQIDKMVTTIKTMLPPDADSWAKVEVLRRYIYQPGPWNDGNAFSYDHDDPYGLDVRNKMKPLKERYLIFYLEGRAHNARTLDLETSSNIHCLAALALVSVQVQMIS